jgi:hypothetical protein
MSTSRYDLREQFVNDKSLYDSFFKERGIKYFLQYDTPRLRYPTKEEIRTLNVIQKIWSYGDSYQKYASEFYGDPEFWWVIGWFNKKPAEFMFKRGQTVYIPSPLEYILDYYGV